MIKSWRKWSCIPGFFLLVSIAGEISAAAVGELQLQGEPAAPTRLQRVEILVRGVPDTAQKYDPETLALDLEVTAPSGKKVRVPGFYFRPFERALEGKREALRAVGEGEWRFRWLPMEAGSHQLRATVTMKDQIVARGDAVSQVADGKHPGLVRVEAEQRRHFCLDDGTPLFLNGLCACWHMQRGTFDYDDWLAAYQKAGMNYIRIWMWPEAFGIEWDRGDRQQYRLDNAWRLDRVLMEAERRGVYVMLCLDYHGMFEVKPDFWNGNNYWPRHPYNATNGGPCRVQNDFFTDAAARRLYEKRLRYIVGRWSAFPNLLAWEFFNEIDNEYAYLKHDDVVAWHRDMGRYLRALDPCAHLISSSFTGNSERPDLFALPEMDFAQYHSYNEKHPAQMTAQKTAKFYEKYRKPFFVSEYGTDWRGWKPDTDPHFRALHQAIWSGVFCGAAGTGMTWWWEHIHEANLYPHWAGLSAFLAGTRLGQPDLQPARFDEVEGAVMPSGLAGPNEALIWLLDRAYDWPEGATVAEPGKTEGAGVTLRGLRDGLWKVEWWSTWPGQCVQTNVLEAKGGSLRLAAPAFRVDLAARLRRE